MKLYAIIRIHYTGDITMSELFEYLDSNDYTYHYIQDKNMLVVSESQVMYVDTKLKENNAIYEYM